MGPDTDDMPPIEDAEHTEIVRSEPRAMLATDRGATALAASVRAQIQARVYLAMQNPRNLALVRDKIKELLKRPALAEKAVYSVKRGSKKVVENGVEKWVDNFAEGPSIRLAESLRKAYGNMDTTDMVLSDDEHQRTIQVVAFDYESNTSESRQVVVSKFVERRGFKDRRTGKVDPPDREIVSSRKNSYGDLVFKCVATDAEVMEMQNSQASRARRNAIVALIEADIVADAVALAKQVMHSKAADQRAKEIVRIRGEFAKIGASEAELADYLGRTIDNATAEDLVGLGMLITAIGDGATTWKSTLKARKEARALEAEDGDMDGPPPAPPDPTKPTKGADATREAVARATGKSGG